MQLDRLESRLTHSNITAVFRYHIRFPHFGHECISRVARVCKVYVKFLKSETIRVQKSLAMCFRLQILILALTIIQRDASAYNINSYDAKVFSVPASRDRRSYFGFSVALYANANESSLLVGAPRANSSELPSVGEPGTVYKCAMSGACRAWTVDDVGNGRHPQLKFDQIKNNSWIGATIAVENKTEARVVVR